MDIVYKRDGMMMKPQYSPASTLTLGSHSETKGSVMGCDRCVTDRV